MLGKCVDAANLFPGVSPALITQLYQMINKVFDRILTKMIPTYKLIQRWPEHIRSNVLTQEPKELFFEALLQLVGRYASVLESKADSMEEATWKAAFNTLENLMVDGVLPVADASNKDQIHSIVFKIISARIGQFQTGHRMKGFEENSGFGFYERCFRHYHNSGERVQEARLVALRSEYVVASTAKFTDKLNPHVLRDCNNAAMPARLAMKVEGLSTEEKYDSASVVLISDLVRARELAENLNPKNDPDKCVELEELLTNMANTFVIFFTSYLGHITSINTRNTTLDRAIPTTRPGVMCYNFLRHLVLALNKTFAVCNKHIDTELAHLSRLDPNKRGLFLDPSKRNRLTTQDKNDRVLCVNWSHQHCDTILGVLDAAHTLVSKFAGFASLAQTRYESTYPANNRTQKERDTLNEITKYYEDHKKSLTAFDKELVNRITRLKGAIKWHKEATSVEKASVQDLNDAQAVAAINKAYDDLLAEVTEEARQREDERQQQNELTIQAAVRLEAVAEAEADERTESERLSNLGVMPAFQFSFAPDPGDFPTQVDVALQLFRLSLGNTTSNHYVTMLKVVDMLKHLEVHFLSNTTVGDTEKRYAQFKFTFLLYEIARADWNLGLLNEGITYRINAALPLINTMKTQLTGFPQGDQRAHMEQLIDVCRTEVENAILHLRKTQESLDQALQRSLELRNRHAGEPRYDQKGFRIQTDNAKKYSERRQEWKSKLYFAGKAEEALANAPIDLNLDW